MKITRHLLTFCLSLTAGYSSVCTAWAGDLTTLGNLSQSQFADLSKDLVAATSSNPMEPAAPLGLSGFDISAAAAMTNSQGGAAWNQASGSGMGQLLQAKLMATKGLPWGVDVGGFVSQLPNTNANASGFHVKYALIEGNAITPAVAVRTSYSRMGGVTQMGLNNTGLDLLISKGFVGLTPYAGIGTVHSTAKVNGVQSLHNESLIQAKSFIGISMNMMLVNLTAEYARIGSTSNIGVKAGLRF